MQITLHWLRQYVDFIGSPEDLAERLTMLGLEVESVVHRPGEFEGVIVAQVITREPHPNAEKLSVCRVQDGRGERQIVCGAHNFQPGDKVPLILPGATLTTKPGEKPFTVKVGKLRGIESHGMMCSGKELGLTEDQEGLLILPPTAVVGQSFAEHLGRTSGDVVYDLEITPNRPDLNSVIGIAREIAAVTGQPLRLPTVKLPAPSTPVAPATDLVQVRLDDPELCPRYTARVIRGVRIGPSPDWLRLTLEKVGLRSINNVVDVTNFVMLETGQPLHAFDYHLVSPGSDGKPTIVVRRAQPMESFITLDGQSHRLSGDMLLIADEQKGIALAGIMGGQNSEIHENTEDVLLECACFQPASIRRTSKSLGLRTDASYRFERGADIGMTDWASRRCAQLILETAGGTLAEGVVDAYPNPQPPRHVTLRHHKVNGLLGIQLTPEEMEYHLTQLGLKSLSRKPRPVDAPPVTEPVTFEIPSFRIDLKSEIDLIEEIARLYGVDRIPATNPRGAVGTNSFDTVFDQFGIIRRLLVGLGLNEAQGQTLISESAARLVTAQPVLLHNPLSSDMSALRPSLLPGLLEALRHNLNRKVESVALFELGRIFTRPPQPHQPIRESVRLAIALTGPRSAAFWNGENRETKFDLFDLKGILETFLDQFGLRAVSCLRLDPSASPFLESASLTLGGKVSLGQFGTLQPALARHYDLRDPVFLAELDVNQLLARRTATRHFKSLPQHPSVRRDLALFVAESITHDAVLQEIRKAHPANLETVELFDIFRGQHVPAGTKSMAYAFTYRHPERTLTDAEVNSTHDHLVAHLTRSLSAQIRG